MRSKVAIFGLTFPLIMVFDFMSKRWALDALGARSSEIFGGLVPLTLAYNKGAAFGVRLGEDSRWFFVPVTIIALVLLGVLFKQAADRDFLRIASISLVVSGAIGNLWDRVRWDLGVVDFIGPIDLAVLLMISLPPAIAWWYVMHPFVGFWRRVGKPITYMVLTVFFLGSMVGLFAIRDALVLTDFGTNWILIGVATGLVIPTIWLSIARAKYLSFAILVGVPELEADGAGGKLLDEGIYAVTRNPRYVEVAMGTLAYASFANYLGGYILAVLTILGIHAVVVFEEKELGERFGEQYDAYKARVPRYIPRGGV